MEGPLRTECGLHLRYTMPSELRFRQSLGFCTDLSNRLGTRRLGCTANNRLAEHWNRGCSAITFRAVAFAREAFRLAPATRSPGPCSKVCGADAGGCRRGRHRINRPTHFGDCFLMPWPNMTRVACLFSAPRQRLHAPDRHCRRPTVQGTPVIAPMEALTTTALPLLSTPTASAKTHSRTQSPSNSHTARSPRHVPHPC